CRAGGRGDRRRHRAGDAMTGNILHPSAPPSHLAPDELRVRPGPDGVSLAIDPVRAGWRYLSFSALSIGLGEGLVVGSAGSETALVVVAGGGVLLEPESGP